MTLVALGPVEEAGSEVRLLRADDGRRFAVFVVDGAYRVTDHLCPHNRGPLFQGKVEDGVITCPWHWYRFDLATGGCLTQPTFRLGVYPVVERAGEWYADVGEKPEPMSMSQRLRAHARGEAP